MSGFAFSHQFSQRWLTTPSAVKQTIVQELDDIVTLLQPTTELEQFQFRVENLNDAVEALMHVERIRQQAEREEAERLAAEQREKERLEQERLEQEQREQERLAQERLEQARLEQERQEHDRIAQEQLEQARLEQDRTEVEQLEAAYNRAEKASKKKSSRAIMPVSLTTQAVEPPSAGSVVEVADASIDTHVRVERHPSEVIYAISDTDNLSTKSETITADAAATTQQPSEVLVKTLATPPDNAEPLAAIKQQIISELQVQIETYLQESMRLMQDDLNQWLEEEVNRQLATHLSQVH